MGAGSQVRAPAEAAAGPGLPEAAPARGGVGRDIWSTTLTQVSVAIGGLLLYRLLAVKQGAEGVASYSLVKQLVIFIWPVAMLGLQTAIPRYVALARDRPGAPEANLLATLLLTGATTASFCGLALASPETTASLVFGDADRTNLVVPLVLTLAATMALEATYGYFRGLSEFRVGNAVRVLSVATFPVVLLVVAGDEDIGPLISAMALFVLLCCTLAAAPPLIRALRGFSWSETLGAGRAMLDYGRRRIPGDVAGVILFAIPPVLAAHFVPLGEVAFLSAGMYVLAVLAIAFQPVGLVFLPLLARLCRSDFEAARRHVATLTTCALHIAIFITPPLVLFADVAIRAWLGPDFEDAATVIRIVVFPAGIYIFNLILRSAVDAASVKAYNSWNNVIALSVAATVATVSLATDVADPLNCIAWSFALGLLTLGLLTLLSVQRVYRLGGDAYRLRVALVLGGVTAGLAWLANAVAIEGSTSLGTLAVVVVLELALAAVYVGGLARAGVEWPAEVRDRMLRRAR